MFHILKNYIDRNFNLLSFIAVVFCFVPLFYFSTNYVLNGWVKFIYDGEGTHTFKKGDCVYAPPSIKHNEIACSDDFEALEILAPGSHQTVKVEE